MKAFRFLMVAIVLSITSSLFVWTGCEYDVTKPQWEEPFDLGAAPKITQIEPQGMAAPGVNYITIYGENFIDVPDNNGVYFDNLEGIVVSAEIADKSQTIIKVRRPNIVSDSCLIKVVPQGTYLPAKSVYRVDGVSEQYGSFVDNVELAVVAVDANENLYVVETSSRNIHKVTSNGDKTNFASASRTPTDAPFGPDGNLYLLSNSANNRYIEKVDLITGEVTDWTRLPQGRGIAKFGDFDDINLYAGSTGSRGLFIVPFNNPDNVISSGFYAGEELLAVRVYSDYLYVVSRTSSSEPAKIWKHQLQSGVLGAQELIFDMSDADSVFSFRFITAISVSSDGKIFIGTDDPNPLLVINLSTSEVDYFYKGIVPDYCKHFNWGTENYLYMISGNTNPAQTWTVYRLDMGSKKSTRTSM